MEHYEWRDAGGEVVPFLPTNENGKWIAVLEAGRLQLTEWGLMWRLDIESNGSFKGQVATTGDVVYIAPEEVICSRDVTLPLEWPSGVYVVWILRLQKVASLLTLEQFMKMPNTMLLQRFLMDLRMRGLLQDIQLAPNGLYLQLKQEELGLAIMSRLIADANDNKTLAPSMAEKARQAAAYLETHLSRTPTLREVARAVTSNRSCLQEAFKQVYHTTIARYSQELRLLHARELLLNPTLSLDDIADETGYFDGANLSKAFKQHFGYGPREWRRGKL